MSFVLDCSVALSWLFPDENDPRVDNLIECLTRESALVPCIWPLEVVNVLLVTRRRGRINDDELQLLLSHAASLPVAIDPAEPFQVFSEVSRLAITHGLSSYDAMYLDLARRRSLPLATLDQRLRKACVAENIKVLPE